MHAAGTAVSLLGAAEGARPYDSGADRQHRSGGMHRAVRGSAPHAA